MQNVILIDIECGTYLGEQLIQKMQKHEMLSARIRKMLPVGDQWFIAKYVRHQKRAFNLVYSWYGIMLILDVFLGCLLIDTEVNTV